MVSIVIASSPTTAETRFPAMSGVSLLVQLEQNNIAAPSSCRRGMCGICMRHVLRGREHLIGLRQPIRSKDTILTCDVAIKDDTQEGEVWLQRV